MAKRTHLFFNRVTLAALCIVAGRISPLSAQDLPDLDELLETPLSELMRVDVSLASGIEESIFDAPAAMVVITAEDIQQRGYTNLAEVITDLPGFDIILANGTSYIFAYQRGYRTPFTQRTLLMVDNEVDNHLWTHEAVMTRQYSLSNIKKIEVLYGPASAIYGPNAFLGIINIVTYDGSEVDSGENTASINVQGGSYSTRSIDVSAKGKVEKFTYAGAARIFRSDEPDLSGKFGFLNPFLFRDKGVWGPLLNLEHRGRELGKYLDPTDDSSFMGSLSYGGAKLKFMRWVRKEAYGPYYAADRVQNNAFWNKSGSRVYLKIDKRISNRTKSRSSISYRESRVWGTWTEALPDTPDSSFTSSTQWNSINNSWLFKQQFEASLSGLMFTGGFKFERKELTKAYDIPGYWNAFSSSVPSNEPGPYGFGAAIGHSRDATYTLPTPPNPEMPPSNLAITEDVGGFVQGILDATSFRFNAGIRFDHNSLYGRSVNPRATAVYKFSTRGALKLLYGEAFQEPAPIQLWGGWSGRLANPNLEPEKARSAEFIAMYQTAHVLHDVSLYYSSYENVIKEEAENAGSRNIWGIEYRGRYTLPNFISNASHISGFFYYTFTHVKSSIHFNHTSGQWEDGDTELGDIAPHKINAGMNVPLQKRWNLNLRGNFVSRRKLYSRNPLRAQEKTLDPYLVLNGALSYTYRPFMVTVKVLNLLNKTYSHPGVEQADSGDDFTSRSLGFRNSLIPQPGRSFVFRFSINY